MKIRYQSRHGLPETVIIRFVDKQDEDLKTWRDGDEIDVAEDRKVRFRVSRDTKDVQVVRAIDALFDCGPDFVDASTGINPDYACTVCGRETLDDFFYTFDPVSGNDRQVALQDGEGGRLCFVHFLVANRDFIDEFTRRGLPTNILDEVNGAIRDEDAKAKPDAKKTPVKSELSPPKSELSAPTPDVSASSNTEAVK